MSGYWEQDLSTESRRIDEDINTIHMWGGARKGDTWCQPGTFQEPKVIESVKRCCDPGYGAIWYEFTFVDGTGARCADDMGFGEIRVTGQKVIK